MYDFSNILVQEGSGGDDFCTLCHSSDISFRYTPSLEDTFFILNKLFQVPVEQCVKSLEQLQQPSAAVGDSAEQLSAGIAFKLCSSCEDAIQSTKLIYQQLVVAVKQFREIQKKLAKAVQVGKDRWYGAETETCAKDQFWHFGTTDDNWDENAPFMVEDLKANSEHITGKSQLEKWNNLKTTDGGTSTSNKGPCLEHKTQDEKHISKYSAAGEESQMGGNSDNDSSDEDADSSESFLESAQITEKQFVKEEYDSEVDDWNTDDEAATIFSAEDATINTSTHDMDITKPVSDKKQLASKYSNERKNNLSNVIRSAKQDRTSNLVSNNCSRLEDGCADKMVITVATAAVEDTKNISSQKVYKPESCLSESEEKSATHSNCEQKFRVQCCECDMYFTERGLSIHMSRQHGKGGRRKSPRKRARQCKTAKRKTGNAGKPEKKFIRETPSEEGKFKCQVEGCGKSFAKQYTLKIHISRHSKQPMFKCQLCDEAFYTKPVLRKHEGKSHPEIVTPQPKLDNSFALKIESYKCSLCSKVFSNNGLFSLHKRRAHGIIDSPKDRVCPEEGCEKTFRGQKSLDMLRAHVSKNHGWEPSYKCSNCDMAFNTWKQKWRHQQKVHQDGNATFPHICDLCGKGFVCADYLHTHRHTKHIRQKTKTINHNNATKGQASSSFMCDICGRSYKSSVALKAHTLQIHDPDKLKAACHLCEKRFLCPRLLENHLYHSHRFGPKEYSRRPPKGEVFECTVTGCRKKFFGDKSKLDQHSLEIHGEDGKKPGAFKCKFCEKSFHVKLRLRHHEMIHENKDSRPFTCNICQKGFPTPYYLYFHKTHTHKLSGITVEHGSKRTISATE